MPRYIVRGTVTISIHTEIDADTKEEAQGIAEDRPFCEIGTPEMFGQYESDYWCHSGEIDGCAKNIEIKQVNPEDACRH